MSDVYLKKSVLANKEYDSNAIGTYVALRMMYMQNKPIRYVSINELCYELYGNTSYTRYSREKIVAGLQQLIDANLVLKTKEISTTEFVLDLSNLSIDSSKGTTDYFVVITTDEIHAIMNYTERVDKFAMLRFFAQVIGSISYITTIKDARGEHGDVHNFVGFMVQSYLAEVSYISESSAITYMQILEELHLLYVYRHTELKWDSESNQISSFVNKYGRYKNRDLIKYFAENYESFTNIETVKKMQKKKDTNYRRSIMQKYRCFCNGTMYDEETIKEMRSYVQLKNEQMLVKIESAESDEQRKKYEMLLLDESVFETKSIV